jgi:hypothetical protein
LKGGGLWFFSKKNIPIPNFAEKNILILVDEKKKNLIQFLSYNLMLNSGKKIRALRDKKNKYSNFCVVRKKNFEQNKKPSPPPLQVKWSGP